ncbi:MAG: ATP-binding cassette domain-containing protein [Neomegalonema sp.]|nr:ATP-binding cassette domain-containing protein [Neomegalonema sp.]
MPTTDDANELLSVRGARFGWPGGEQFLLNALNIHRGGRIALVGASGGGKTTLLSLLAGVMKPLDGAVDILGTDIAQLSGPARDRFRGDHMGIIFQMFNLLPYGGAVDNVLLPLSFSTRRRRRAQAARSAPEEAARLLAALGLDPDQIGARAISKLSVGQQQRVAAARALIGRPELILADEPTSALDPASTDEFLALLFAEAEAAGAAVLCVTHDPRVAERFDQKLQISDLLEVRSEAA